jgi:hypothetical protein
MNLELDEEYGAGFEGTKALLYKYLKDTPGQKIIKYMDKNNIVEVLKKSDPVEVWIRDFIDSDDIRFAGKTKEERIKMALGAYYAAQRNESVDLEEDSAEYLLNKWRETGRIAYRRPGKKLISLNGGPNMPEKQALDKIKAFFDQQKKNESVDLEENAGYVETLHTKYKFLRRQADEAEEKYKKAKERKLDDDSLETYYTAVRTLNDRADDVYDAYVDARDKAKKNESVELEETVDFRAMKDADLKQWLSKNNTNDSVSPVFGAQILSAKKEAKRRGIDINEGKIPVTEVKSSANLKVGDSVKVTLSSGTTNWSTGKTTRPEVTAKGIITKIADTEQSIHAGDIAKEYTVKYKSSLTGKTETSRFRHVMPESAQVKFATELEEAIIDVKKYECGSEKSQFGGYRPHIINKETGKTMYLGQASYNTTSEAKAHAENYLKQYAQGIQHPKVPIKGTYIKEDQQEISLETRRMMKTIALVTGNTNADALYEYALTSPTYSSLVELKENFNKYIQDA